MSLILTLRDFFLPPEDIRAQVDIQPSFQMLVYECGVGSHTLAAARLVGPEGKIHALDIHSMALQKVVCTGVLAERHTEKAEGRKWPGEIKKNCRGFFPLPKIHCSFTQNTVSTTFVLMLPLRMLKLLSSRGKRDGNGKLWGNEKRGCIWVQELRA
jgi:hypothetical protein